ICELGLQGVKYQRTLGQADRGPATASADRRIQVALPDGDRLPDTGAIHAQTGKEFIQPAYPREHSFQHMTLNLACGVANHCWVQAGEPLITFAAAVRVAGDTQNVSPAQGVCPPTGDITGRLGTAGRPVARCFIGCRGPGAETSCGPDDYQ